MKARATGLFFLLSVSAALFALQISLDRSHVRRANHFAEIRNVNAKNAQPPQEQSKIEPAPPRKFDPIAWDAFLEWEDDQSEKLELHYHRLGDARTLLEEQLVKIERKQHTIPTILRVEQVLGQIHQLNEALAVVEKAYANASEPKSEMYKNRLEDTRDLLAKITHAKNGNIAQARDALVRLIDVLEKDRESGLEAVREARKRLDELAWSMRHFRDRIGPGITCYSLVEFFATIEMQQRRLTHHLEVIHRSPVLVLPSR